MSKAKKVISLSISEDLLLELREWRQICHDENLQINQSDLISILIFRGLEQLTSDIEEVSCLNTLVQELAVDLHDYYMKYDLALRREDGVED